MMHTILCFIIRQTRQHLIWESMTVLQHLRQQAMYLSVTLKRRLNKKMRKIGVKYFAPIFLQQKALKRHYNNIERKVRLEK